MRKPYVLASAMLLAVAFVTAAVLDAPHVINQILLPLLAVLATGSNRCFKRRGSP